MDGTVRRLIETMLLAHHQCGEAAFRDGTFVRCGNVGVWEVPVWDSDSFWYCDEHYQDEPHGTRSETIAALLDALG